MSIETPPSRPDLDPRLAARSLVKERPPGVLERASDAADVVLAPLDQFKDTLAGDLAQATRTVEAKTRAVPVLGQVAQFATGAVGALWGMAEGTYQTFRHPVQTLQGLWTLASHVPVVSPMWWATGFSQGFGRAWEGDKVFWKAVGQGYLAPFAADWKAGRYFAVAGRATVEVGTLVIGLKNAKAAYDGWKANRAAMRAADDVAAMRPGALDDGLRAAVLGDEPRLTGQVLGEGVTVVEPPGPVARPRRPGEAMRTFEERVGPRLAAAEAKPRRVKFEGNLDDLADHDLGRLTVDKETFRRLRQVGPKRMQQDVSIRSRFEQLTTSVDTRMDDELTRLLGVTPQGAPKRIDRAAAKLTQLQELKGPKMRLDDLDDLARGRIDLPAFDPQQMKGMLDKIRTHFGDQNLIVNDYVTHGKPFYKGRLHVKIRDRSGLWYELQMGPRQLSAFYDTPFKLGGKSLNIHDAVYKGVMMLNDEAVKAVGKGSLARGQQLVADVLDSYVAHMEQVMDLAKQGQRLDFKRHTASLRQALIAMFEDVPADHLPLGLR